ncbi:uncharacterized protein Dwil_GK19957 [Drosophila willistoni]|uniref:Uncharacterized protein n=2 Tax=Drosophila willistoni TaxID=7260 RepID=B4MSE2_DROWI|nr:uncharacterized protein Dwil_GK19957 [Drosophila willistoni]
MESVELEQNQNDDEMLKVETNEKEEQNFDEDQVRFVADAFSDVKLYLQTGRDESAFVELGPTNIHKFQLPPSGCKEVETGFNPQEKTAVDEWQTDAVNMGEMVEIDLIQGQEEQSLGHIQRDENTGEMYMLVPVEIDMLVNHLAHPIDIEAASYEVHEITVPQLTLPLTLDFTPDDFYTHNEEGEDDDGADEDHCVEMESNED